MHKNELERRAYNFTIAAEESESGSIITGRPIVYGSRANIGFFDEIIERGALDNANLKDVRFLVNHDISKIPLARSRRNNGKSTMQLTVDDQGMAIRVNLDTENNSEARSLYSAVQRGDISGMSFMFSIDGEEWENLETDHPTRHVRSIGSVVEVSAVTFPAYDATEITARSKNTLYDARSRATVEKAREISQNAKSSDGKNANQKELELAKLKTRSLLLAKEIRFNKTHDSKGRFASGGGGGGGSTEIKNPMKELHEGDKITWETNEFDGKFKADATVTEVHEDHIIAKTDDGMSLWLDGDSVDSDHKIYKK